jgi:CRP/FNR family transcriptional regulator, cyclic AMP receptor protein
MVQPEPPLSNPHLVDTPVTVADLRGVGLFGAVADSVLAGLTETLDVERVPPGTIIFREGDAALCLYVLIDGEVEVLKKSHAGREHRVAVLGPTDCFGEMSLIDVQPRSATVRTVAPARLLRMTSEDFDHLYRQDLKSYALVVLNIARDLSRRLRVADAILADVAGSVVDRYVGARK